MRRLEVAAIIIVACVVLGTPAAVFGYESLVHGQTATEYKLVGNDGHWNLSSIHVKQGAKVKLRLTSNDVAHGFSAPDLNINVPEIYPGKFVDVEFVAEKAGTFPFFCTVLCSSSHGSMNGKIIVEGDSGAAGASPSSPPSAVDAGKAVFEAKCAACHGPTGQGAVGPSLVGASAARVSAQVRNPKGAMPPFPASALSDDDLKQLETYIDSLSGAGSSGPASPTGGTSPSPAAASPPSPSADASAASADAGKQAYAASCTACHGANARGGVGPAIAGASSATILRQVRTPRGAMPPFPPSVLSDRDVSNIAAYLGGLGSASTTGSGSGATGTPSSPPASAPSASPAVPSASLSEGGQPVYLHNCAPCHGNAGQGGVGPSIAGASSDRVTRQVRTPKGIMPAFPTSVLSDDALQKLVDYLNSLGNNR